MLLWVKNSIFWQEVHYYMVYIAYYTELNLEIFNYAQNNAIVAKIVNTRLMKIRMAIFALAERLPTSFTLLEGQIFSSHFKVSQFLFIPWQQR